MDADAGRPARFTGFVFLIDRSLQRLSLDPCRRCPSESLLCRGPRPGVRSHAATKKFIQGSNCHVRAFLASDRNANMSHAVEL
jgi:hypothetical protein